MNQSKAGQEDIIYIDMTGILFIFLWSVILLQSTKVKAKKPLGRDTFLHPDLERDGAINRIINRTNQSLYRTELQLW